MEPRLPECGSCEIMGYRIALSTKVLPGVTVTLEKVFNTWDERIFPPPLYQENVAEFLKKHGWKPLDYRGVDWKKGKFCLTLYAGLP